MTVLLPFPLLLLPLACPSTPGETPGPSLTTDGGTTTDGGGTTSPTDGGTATTDGGTTLTGPSPEDEGGVTPDTGKPVPTWTCPAPPEDAWVFHAGTVVSDQAYFRSEDNGNGWMLTATGISYVHEQECTSLVPYNWFEHEVKSGLRPGDFLFELMLTVPGDGITDWLGEHDSGGGYLFHREFSAHYLKIGWRDDPKSVYHMVHSLPHGWTDSTVCVSYLSPDRLYLTVLWDPAEGPYRTNAWTSIDHPIWFDLEIWPTANEYGAYDPVHGSRRSCAVTAWADVTEEELFAGFDWWGQYPGDWEGWTAPY